MSAEQEARLRSARQALTIARGECIARFRQSEEYAELTRKLRDTQARREQARSTGTPQQQRAADDAHLKLLMSSWQLMENAMSVDAGVVKAAAALKAEEAVALGQALERDE